MVEGRDEDVKQFIAWAHRGPPSAEVFRVDTEEEQPNGVPGPFRIEA
jgi:acylphosphatase